MGSRRAPRQWKLKGLSGNRVVRDFFHQSYHTTSTNVSSGLGVTLVPQLRLHRRPRVLCMGACGYVGRRDVTCSSPDKRYERLGLGV